MAYILDILERKISSYEDFNNNFPGFGGFLPWFTSTDQGLTPIAPGWSHNVPALDNGQLLWSMYAAVAQMQNYSVELTQRYQNYLNMMTQNAKMIFYAGNGNVRTVTVIANTSATPFPQNYAPTPDCNPPPPGWQCYLDDPYEGELFTWWIDIFGTWTNQTERDLLWVNKRGKLQSVEFAIKGTNQTITVQRGWWFSAHEQWKLLYLPYLDVTVAQNVFSNCEKARVWNSVQNKIPGLYASVTDVSSKKNPIPPDYVSACGIASIAFETIDRSDLITPYGTFPLFLVKGLDWGLPWYNNMLQGNKMQGPHGSTESTLTNGTRISSCLTHDSKTTTVVAMLGGISHIVKQSLDPNSLQRFYQIVQREHSLAFPNLNGLDIDFVLPQTPIPKTGDFSQCRSTPFD